MVTLPHPSFGFANLASALQTRLAIPVEYLELPVMKNKSMHEVLACGFMWFPVHEQKNEQKMCI